MNTDTLAELRSLQARAYGPTGDIESDPDALHRLEELQARRAPAFPAPVEVPAEATGATWDRVPVGTAADEVSLPLDTEDVFEAAAPSDPDLPERGGFRRWMPWLWVASLLVVAVITAAWTTASLLVVLTPIDRGADVRQVVVLESVPDFPAPGFFASGDFELTGFHEFHGMTVIASTGGWGGPEGETCLWLANTADLSPDAESVDGPLFSGCGAGEFAPSVEATVTSEMPAAILERFPEGSALQFVLDGSRVGVFSDAD